MNAATKPAYTRAPTPETDAILFANVDALQASKSRGAAHMIAAAANALDSITAKAQALEAERNTLILALAWLVGLKDERPSDYEEQKPLAWAAARAAIAPYANKAKAKS